MPALNEQAERQRRGRALLGYQQRLAVETRGPLTTRREVSAWKRKHKIDPKAIWSGY